MTAPVTFATETFRQGPWPPSSFLPVPPISHRRFRQCQLEVSGLLVQKPAIFPLRTPQEAFSGGGWLWGPYLSVRHLIRLGISGLWASIIIFWRWSTLAIPSVGLSGEAFLPPARVAERLCRRWLGIELSFNSIQMSFGPQSGPFSSREAGGAVFGLDSLPEGRSLWGKPGLGGFEPARGEAPIEAAVWRVKELKVLDLKLNR